MDARISTRTRRRERRQARCEPPVPSKRGPAAYVIGAKELNPSWVLLYGATFAAQFFCASSFAGCSPTPSCGSPSRSWAIERPT